MSKWFNLHKKDRTEEVEILKFNEPDLNNIKLKSDKDVRELWNRGLLDTQEKLYSKSFMLDPILFGPKR